MDKAKMLLAACCVAGLLVSLSLLHPAGTYSSGPVGTEITPTCFAYMPCVLRPGPPGVDLLIWDIKVDPSTPVAGQTFSISVTVKNQGGDSVPHVTEVRLDAGPFQNLRRSIVPLAGGATVDIVWGLVLSAGAYTAEAEVDPGDTVAETNESNNVLEQPFTVVSP
jgi:hypothetical protein